MGFPGGSDSEDSACNVGDLGSIPGLGISPGGGHGNPLQYSYLENPHGQRSLVGYSPWGCKELDTTEVTKHTCFINKYVSRHLLHTYHCARSYAQHLRVLSHHLFTALL